MLLFLSFIFGKALFCEDNLWTNNFVCEDRSIVNANGCCERTSKCPLGCMSFGYDTRGKCYCDKCPREQKIELSITERLLKAHNYFRCRHDQPFLIWDMQQENTAIEHANKCLFTHSDTQGNYGENLAMGYSNPEDATEGWYNEITNPGYIPGSTFTPGVGHYTALIWKLTSKLGCSRCNKSKIDVCQYSDETPNMNSLEYYLENVPQDNTPVKTEKECCDQVYN